MGGKVSKKFEGDDDVGTTSSPGDHRQIAELRAIGSSVALADGDKGGKHEKSMYPIVDYVGNNEEVDRLQLQHHLLRLVFEGNFHAPLTDMLNSGANVLDVGCGPATWCLEMATQFKKSTFVGIDMFQVFPRDCRPVNTTFYYSNILDGLPFADDSFDIVYQRDICLGLSKKQWPRVLKELYRVTRPGGYIELCEPDLEVQRVDLKVENSWNKATLRIASNRGMDPHVGKNIHSLLTDAGINNVQGGYINIPLGDYGGRAGKYMTDNFRELARQLKPVLLPVMRMSDREYEQSADQAFRSWNDNRSYFNMYWAYGQKPMAA